MKDEGTIIICSALSKSKASKLQELDLGHNDITFEGAESVAAYLAVTASLTTVWTPAHEPSLLRDLPPHTTLLMLAVGPLK